MGPVSEFDQYAAALTRAAASVEGLGRLVVGRVGKRALDTARRAAPRDTGRLARGLRLKVKGERAIVGVTNFYATFQEFGTSRMAPNPFIGPAFDRHAPELVREVERGRDKMLRGL